MKDILKDINAEITTTKRLCKRSDRAYNCLSEYLRYRQVL